MTAKTDTDSEVHLDYNRGVEQVPHESQPLEPHVLDMLAFFDEASPEAVTGYHANLAAQLAGGNTAARPRYASFIQALQLYPEDNQGGDPRVFPEHAVQLYAAFASSSQAFDRRLIAGCLPELLRADIGAGTRLARELWQDQVESVSRAVGLACRRAFEEDTLTLEQVQEITSVSSLDTYRKRRRPTSS